MTGLHFADRARALVGTRFRPQGRDPATGLDCIGLVAACFDIPSERVPRDYRLRGGDLSRIKREMGEHFRRVPLAKRRPGDVLLFSISAEQAHLAVGTPEGLVHADARLRRIVERPGPMPWPLAAVFRRRLRRRRNG